MKPFRYFVPTETVFETGALDSLAERCRKLGLGGRPLVVTGCHSARRTGLLDRVRAQFPEAEVFDEVEENPATGTCERGGTRCRDGACDFVIGLGGGSAIDAAKAIAILARNPAPCRTYYGADKYAEPNLPVVAVPTTAGTGSEVTPYAVIVDAETGSKRTISGRRLFPVLAVLDPALTVTLPREATINTGLDALSQAMEGIVSRTSTPVGDALGLEACRVVREWLPKAVRDGNDLEARSQMLYASMLSGCIIAQSGTTLVHGMGYYYTLEYGVAHGRANALLLTPLFQFNAECEPAKVAAIAEALGHPSKPEQARRTIALALHGLFAGVGLPAAARDAGVAEDRLETFATDIASDPYRFRNQPGRIDAADVLRFFRQSYEGTIA